MKIKQAVTFLFIFGFAIYNLCPVLMQGNCGLPLSDATSIGESSQHCHRETPAPRFQWDLKQELKSTPTGFKATPIRSGFKGTCHVPTTGSEKEDSNTPHQNNRHAVNCCVIGIELTRPSESDNLNQHRWKPLSSRVVLPSPSTIPPVCEAAFHPHPVINLYDCFEACPVSPRAPPVSFSLLQSHI